jgi:hypothetical protein
MTKFITCRASFTDLTLLAYQTRGISKLEYARSWASTLPLSLSLSLSHTHTPHALYAKPNQTKSMSSTLLPETHDVHQS